MALPSNGDLAKGGGVPTRIRSITPFALTVVASVLLPALAYADYNEQPYDLDAEINADAWFGYALTSNDGGASVGPFGDILSGSFSGSAYRFDLSPGYQVSDLDPNLDTMAALFGIDLSTNDDGVITIGPTLGNSDGLDNKDPDIYHFSPNYGHLPICGFILPQDSFGVVIVMTSTVVAVGVDFDDANGTHSGSVYLFDVATGNQIGKLAPPDLEAYDHFGYSLSVDNGILAVGAPGADISDTDSGMVYLFDVNTGAQLAQLHPRDGDAHDSFGYAVAISNDTVAISAYQDDDLGTNSGSVYLFSASSAAQIAKLHASDGAAGDYFGWAIDIDNDVLAIGAPGVDIGDSIDAGSAYTFDVSNANQIGKHTPPDISTGDQLGNSIDISNGMVALAAIEEYDLGTGSGTVIVFDIGDSQDAPDSPACPWDLDNDGRVGSSDLVALFAKWTASGPADFDESGSVDTGDMLELLENWGLCP